MKGNHLMVFDGSKQQIIKLDASIGLKQAAKNTVSEAAKQAAPAPVAKGRQKDNLLSHQRELDDPNEMIRQNKQSVQRYADANSSNEILAKAKPDERRSEPEMVEENQEDIDALNLEAM